MGSTLLRSIITAMWGFWSLSLSTTEVPRVKGQTSVITISRISPLRSLMPAQTPTPRATMVSGSSSIRGGLPKREARKSGSTASLEEPPTKITWSISPMPRPLSRMALASTFFIRLNRSSQSFESRSRVRVRL